MRGQRREEVRAKEMEGGGLLRENGNGRGQEVCGAGLGAAGLASGALGQSGGGCRVCLGCMWVWSEGLWASLGGCRSAWGLQGSPAGGWGFVWGLIWEG